MLGLHGAHADHHTTPARARRQKSGWPEARLAFELHRSGRIAEAIDGYRAALSENPKMAGTWYALGCAELARDAIGAAIPCFRRALALRPGWAMAELAFGKALFGLGRVDAAIEQVRRAAHAKDPAVRREALRYWAVVVPGGTRSGNGAVLEARRRWASLEAPSPRPGHLVKSAHARPGKRLRVGYVSAFFASAHWMKPVWAAVNHHHRDAFEIHFFADRAGPMDAVGYRSHRLDRVHDLTALSNEAAAHCVAAAKIDVLVDLNAYSFPQRLGLFMRRPAPIQLGWFNTYATTGIDAFDYIIGDHAVIPTNEERFYTERVLRVAGSYLAFEVLHACPDVVRSPCLERGHLTFGSFGSQYKMTDDVVSAWATILRKTPHQARLLIKNRALDETSTRSEFLRRFERRGVDASRITLEGGAEHLAFLGAYGGVDIALDTFPYSGGTTTMEALWQGVPVLTFDGDRWASRTSLSLLLAAGLSDWCLPSRHAYIERAIALAQDPGTPAMLASLRTSMRERLSQSAACDGRGLARSLEGLYREAIAEASSRARRGRRVAR